MRYNQVIMSYANAIFEASKKANNLDETFEKLEDILELIRNNPDVRKALSAPVIDFDQKNKVIEVISQKLGLGQAVQNLLLLLAKNKRFNLLEEVIDAYSESIKVEKNILEARITTAKELNDTEYQELQRIITEKYNKNFTFKKFIDNSLIGGLIVEFDNKILDASVQGALKKFKNKSKEIISVL
ncbi:MAG: atpH [Rickettsiaceae bacterium]|jgi:ATP synthase F1 delta subunit|nr:atpH [Rickettsiaceae bacterium]